MLSRLGTLATGNYYVGANIVALLPVVAGLPFAVLTPRFFQVYATSSRGDSLVPLLETPLRDGSVLFAAGIGAGALAIPSTVSHLWPRLVDGIPAAELAALGTFPVVLFGLVTNVFYAMNRLIVELGLLALGASVGLACAHFAVGASPTIAAAAGGSVVGLFVTYVAGTLAAYHLMVGRWRAGLTLVGGTLRPAAFAVFLFLVCNQVGAMRWPEGSLVRAAASESLYFACFAPWIARVLRRVLG
jgi:hypothetical protein